MRRKLLCILLVVSAALLLTACGASPVTSGTDEPDAAPTGADKPDAGGGETAPEQRVSVSGGGSYVRVPPAGFRSLVEEEGVVVVNTHVPFEGDLPSTDLSVPYDEIGQSLDRLPEDKNARIAVYGKSGRMSAEAAEELVARGYGNVWDLEGGMDAWQRAGLPLEVV